MKQMLIMFACGGLLVSTSFSTVAGTIYSNDFEGAVGAEWSNTTTATTPAGGRRFLGIFGNETVTFTLNSVPDNQTVSLSFDLFIINTWDGSQLVDPLSIPLHTVGPDIWSVGVAGGPTLINTTFSVFDGTKAMHSFRDFPQAYPGTHPTDSFPARTGAAENETLGYFEGDSVYSLSFDFHHDTGPLALVFALNSPVGDPEAWGIDNVHVTGQAVIPEPSSIVLFGLGAVSLLGYGWRRKRKQAA